MTVEAFGQSAAHPAHVRSYFDALCGLDHVVVRVGRPSSVTLKPALSRVSFNEDACASVVGVPPK